MELLTELCHSFGTMVLIDGAHAPGVLEIDVKAINADFYTGNCHKWLFTPKGCAFLWVSPSFRSAQCPQPAVISSSGKYDFVGRFAYTGTRDYTPFCALPAALSFIETELGGMQLMRSYCKALLRNACDHLVREWRTGYLVPFEMQAFMGNVILPLTSAADAQTLQRRLLQDHDISVVFGVVVGTERNEIHFLRISAQVYLELSDFVILASAVKHILGLQ